MKKMWKLWQRKYCTPFLLVVTNLFFTATIAYAVVEVTTSLNQNTNIIIAIAIIFTGLCNLWGVSYLAKRYMAKVDKDADAIPKLVQMQEILQKTLEELITIKNKHDKEITQINMIHQMRGCDRRLGANAIEAKKV